MGLMQILLATSNPYKLEEIVAIWATLGRGGGSPRVELVGLDTVDPGRGIPEPVEDQPTFEGNATLKARYYATATGVLTIADDSGLEVDALGGAPGVRSARYSGVTGPRGVVDGANNDRLLHELADVPTQQRTARFVCAMALVAPPGGGSAGALGLGEGVLAVVRGVIKGRVIGPGQPPRGSNGFGYDPLFEVVELGKTTAQLSPKQKNRISHRGQAAGMMWARLEALGLMGQGA